MNYGVWLEQKHLFPAVPGESMLIRPLLITVLFFLPLWMAAANVFASFHTGGVGSCGGCHVSQFNNGSITKNLLASDPSSICLTCHAGPGGSSIPSILSFDGSALTPGGDFYWLTKTFTWATGSSPSASHGHNVTAYDFGLTSDPYKVRSPGGNYPSTLLSCISCHDPHGRSGRGTDGYGSAISRSGSYGQTPDAGTVSGHYRLLGGAGYSVNGYEFNYSAPLARQNGARPFSEADDSHVDYGSGVSEWCANCHQAILASKHRVGAGKFVHPVGGNETLDSVSIDRYNRYLSSGNLGGSINTAYLQFVPFERGTAMISQLDPTSTRGPDNNARLNCLTCHRAHASAFQSIGRWDFTASLLAESHPAMGDGSATGTDVLNSYYGRDVAVEFGANQGSFCEKCHAASSP